MALLDFAIDVSDAQGTIDWRRVAGAGIRVAMIKATEGATFIARHWEYNSRSARAAGILVIPYHFMTHADPPAQAANFAQATGLRPGMPFALDWERRRLRDGSDNTAAAAQVEEVGLRLAELAGRLPLGYWGIPGSTPEEPTDRMLQWERWVPRYRRGAIASFAGLRGEFASPGVDFLFWQYTCAGRVPGIRCAVDRSVALFDSHDQLTAWYDGASGTLQASQEGTAAVDRADL